MRLCQDLKKNNLPDFSIEKSLSKKVIALDEVGRGPLAGPVVSCSCIFFDHSIPLEELQLIDDSKKLTSLKRYKALRLILKMKKENKLNYRIGSASVE